MAIMDTHIAVYLGGAKPLPAGDARDTLRELYYHERRACIHAVLRECDEGVNLVFAKHEEISQSSYRNGGRRF